MFDNLLQSSADGQFGIWGLFLVLVACGLGLPLPEDIVLFASGILAAQTRTSLVFVMSLMYVGILAGDSIIYGLGRFLGRRFLASRFGRWLLPEARIQRAGDLVGRHGTWIVCAARFMPGLRAPTFFTTGLLKFSFWKFLFADGIAAVLSAPLFVFLGHWAYGVYANNVEQLEEVVDRGKVYVLAIVGVVACGGGLWLWRKYRRSKLESSSSSRSSL